MEPGGAVIVAGDVAHGAAVGTAVADEPDPAALLAAGETVTPPEQPAINATSVIAAAGRTTPDPNLDIVLPLLCGP